MPYIRIQFEGHKTFGGYLTIDGDVRNEIKLTDGQLISVRPGFHQLNINSMNRSELLSNKMRRDNPNSVFYEDEWKKYENSLDCSINHDFAYYDVMTIVIMSGYNKAILETPKYVVNTLSSEQYNTLEKEIEQKEQACREEAARQAAIEVARPINKIKKGLRLIKNVVLWIVVAFLALIVISAIVGGETIWTIAFWAIIAFFGIKFCICHIFDL